MDTGKSKIESITQEAIHLYGKLWMIENEIVDALKLYLSISDSKNRRNFLEIGAAHGASFHILAHWFSNLKISIDLPNTAGSVYGHGDEEVNSVVKKREELWKLHYSNVYPIIGDSSDVETVREVNSILNGESLDLLFIDGDHSENSVRFDYETYGRLVRSGGVILFHDIFMKSFGVYKVWESIEGEKYSFGKNIGMGLYIKS